MIRFLKNISAPPSTRRLNWNSQPRAREGAHGEVVRARREIRDEMRRRRRRIYLYRLRQCLRTCAVANSIPGQVRQRCAIGVRCGRTPCEIGAAGAYTFLSNGT